MKVPKRLAPTCKLTSGMPYLKYKSKFKEVKERKRDLKPFLKIKAKNSQNKIWSKMAKFYILQFSRDAEYDFFKENYMNNFHTKNWDDS